jgi:proliferating cell nuclear antigen
MNIVINNLQKTDTFANIFQHIKAFTENINIMFEKERMYIQSMDNSRISIFEIYLPNTWFDKYELSNNENIVIGINSLIFHRILNSKEKTQSIEFIFNKEDSDKLFVHFISENKAEFDKHFEVPLIELDYEMMEIPESENEAEFTISSMQFSNIVNQLKLFGDTMNVTCSEEKIFLYSYSQDNGKMFVEIKIDDLNSFIINEGQSIKLSYSLHYLHNICLYNKISEEIEIKLKENFPMKVVYKLNNDENSKMVFYLAPKIKDDDE